MLTVLDMAVHATVFDVKKKRKESSFTVLERCVRTTVCSVPIQKHDKRDETALTCCYVNISLHRLIVVKSGVSLSHWKYFNFVFAEMFIG